MMSACQAALQHWNAIKHLDGLEALLKLTCTYYKFTQVVNRSKKYNNNNHNINIFVLTYNLTHRSIFTCSLIV